jgi:hypothetical protein
MGRSAEAYGKEAAVVAGQVKAKIQVFGAADRRYHSGKFPNECSPAAARI